MPKYFLPIGASPFNDSLESKIFEAFSETFEFSQKKFKNLNLEQKWEIANAFFAANPLVNGNIIPFTTAIEMMGRFQSAPKTFKIKKETLLAFQAKIADLAKSLPANHELGLRFYLGTDGNAKYDMVIVPMCGPITQPGTPRDRYKEKEKSFFPDTNPFFALVASADAVSTNVADCEDLISTPEEDGTIIAYFLYEIFLKFISDLQKDKEYTHLYLCFGRTIKQELTIIMMFLDKDGNPLYSSGIYSGINMSGICLDQGDLIPPPFPSKIDTSFGKLP